MLLEFGLIFMLSLILIKVIIINPLKLGLVDVPNDRSIHVYHHPRGAGIGFFLAVALVVPFFHLQFILTHIYVLLAILMVFIVGVLDDYKDMAPKTKFIVIALSSILVCQNGICIETLGEVGDTKIMLGWVSLPFSIFAIVGLTNSLNLIDGLDGLAGLLSIVILSTFLMIGLEHQDAFMIILSSTLIVSLFAFLVYNWNPASIFMGDSGSLVLGFVISLLAVNAINYIHPITVLFLVAVPFMDTLIVMVRRKRESKSMFEADKTHLHHILYGFFNKDIKMTTIFLVILQLIYSMTGLMIVDHSNQILTLMLFLLNVTLLYFITTGMLRRQALIDMKDNT